MDTGLIFKPAPSVAQMGDARPAAAPNAVATELAPAKTVTAASATAPSPAIDDTRKREIILDPHSREVIFRVVDERSRRVIRQVPEEALRRLRAYARGRPDKQDGENAFDTTA